MLVKAARLCLYVTQDLVNIIADNAQSSPESLPAPWYNIFCKKVRSGLMSAAYRRSSTDMHSCAIVFVIGHLCLGHVKHVSIMTDSTLIKGFERCLAFFHDNQPHSPSAQKCYKIRHAIKQDVFVKHTGKASAIA
jgi:hypothetical protein